VPLSEEKYQALEQKRLSAMKETVTKIGVTGTPPFIINGQPVVGANIPQIEKLLGGNK
jgi:protein-disulfide isomerase